MAHVSEKFDQEASIVQDWLRDALATFDVVATLTSALAPAWTVEREVDPSGDLSIIVLPVVDDPSRPTFVLYEEDGLVQVSTLLGETWQNRQSFRTCQRAVAAIITAAASSRR